MKKKIIFGVVLVLCIYAFPIRLFDLSKIEYNALKIVKCLLFSSIILRLIRNEFGSIKYLFGKIDKKIIFYLPVLILSSVYILLNLSIFDIINKGNIKLTILALLATLFATFSEEIVFRGYFQKLFIKNNMSIKKSIIVSSMMFSSLHMANIYRYDYDVWSIFGQICIAFFFGLFFGALFVLRQNIIFITSLHFIYNLPTSLYSINTLELTHTQNVAATHISLAENIISVIIYILIHLPVLLLGMFYLKEASKRKQSFIADVNSKSY